MSAPAESKHTPQIVGHVVIRRADHEDLVVALRGLRNEVHGMLRLERAGILDVVGATNVGCLEFRIREADLVLAKVSK